MKKTKIMVFAKRPKLYKLTINGYKTEETKVFRYIGVVFQANGAHRAQAEYVVKAAQRSASATLNFFYITKGGNILQQLLKCLKLNQLTNYSMIHS